MQQSTPSEREGGGGGSNDPTNASQDASPSSQTTPLRNSNNPKTDKIHLLIADLTRTIQDSRVFGEDGRVESLCEIRKILQEILYKPALESLAKTAKRLERATKLPN